MGDGAFAAHAQTIHYQALHEFGPFFDSVRSPNSVIQAKDGTFYGTSQQGDPFSAGTLFQFTTDGTSSVLGDFDGVNGAYPLAPLVEDSDGNFYGTTSAGGANGNGEVFKGNPNGAENIWVRARLIWISLPSVGRALRLPRFGASSHGRRSARPTDGSAAYPIEHGSSPPDWSPRGKLFGPPPSTQGHISAKADFQCSGGAGSYCPLVTAWVGLSHFRVAEKCQ